MRLPGPGPVVVKFPSPNGLPKAFPSGSVSSSTAPEPAARERATPSASPLPPAPAIMCDVIGPGRLTIAFGRSAGLGNPARAGTYTISATRQAAVFSTRFPIDSP